MRNLFIVFLIIGVLTSGLVLYLCPELFWDLPPPTLQDEYFGKRNWSDNSGIFPKDDHTIKPFKINVDDSVLEDLKTRLNNTRYVEPLDNVKFHYGFRGTYLKEVVEYWKTEFDWRKQEKELNKLNHFKTQIEGIDVHFIRQKPTVKGSIRTLPLLLLHGWPGTFVEFAKVVPFLISTRDSRDYVFEVIAPSIPGYGFSEAPHQAGFDVTAAARIFVKLMDRLGLEEFYLHGGDWGSAISTVIAKIYPKRVMGLHLTMVADQPGLCGYLKYFIAQYFPSLFNTPQQYSLFYPPSNLLNSILEESGYLHIKATKPDTIGAALSDSPAGLAAFILQKISTGTDFNFRDLDDGGLTKKFTLDDLLTTVMVYWVTNTVTSSMRLYKEMVQQKYWNYKLHRVPVRVPAGIAAFPNEPLVIPEYFVRGLLRNLVRYCKMSRGGHLAAMEEPKDFADDIWDFIVDVESSRKTK